MYQAISRSEAVDWVPPDFPGVEMKVLYEDEATGATAVLTRIGPGAFIPAHYHALADETVFVLAGDFIEDGIGHGPGAFFAGKAGTPHGPHPSRDGCTVLTHFGAELDSHLAEG